MRAHYELNSHLLNVSDLTHEKKSVAGDPAYQAALFCAKVIGGESGANLIFGDESHPERVCGCTCRAGCRLFARLLIG
jgi:hypothetical protein